MDNPFASVIRTALMTLKGERKNENKIFSSKNTLLKNLLISKLPKPHIKKLITFLNLYVRFEREELNVKFEKNIQSFTQKNKSSMGIIEQVLDIAKTEGYQKGEKVGEKIRA